MDSDRELLIGNPSDWQNEAINRNYDSVNNTEELSVEDRPNKLPQYVATISATLSALSAGVVLGWTSPISDDIKTGKYNHISVNENEIGWIGSFTTLGALMFSLITGKVCDVIGRKSTLILLIIPFGIGWILILWANNLAMLYFGRCITGMAAGACSIAAPLYINEISQKEIRGTLGSYFQLMVTVGILYAYCFGKFLSIVNYTVMCSLVPAAFVFVFIFQPETPLYYLKTSQYNKAVGALKHLRGNHYNVQTEIQALENSLTTNDLKISDIFNRRTIKAMSMTLALMFFQQFSGVNAIIFYTSHIFDEAHVHVLDAKTASIFVSVMQVIATFISSLIVDKSGRKVLLIGSTFVMSISCLLLGLFFSLKYRTTIDTNTMNALGFLPVLSLCLYIIAFSLGLGPIPWIIPSEMFNSDIKGIASSFVGSFNWFLAFFITKFYLDIETVIGQDTSFYIFSCMCLIGSLFVYFILPETKGKSSEEIQNALDT
ncbi:facilitated trehalose transporter tret1-1-like protein [Holotrichia oblita]|uniref:Facilitated trehalose transporter tret1-1-like protein n=1 Tax=Holotrichia oblita TaxID=644536 RepID=A0ACB9TVM3_HOLOL|nr:facilitated trehalose transporter tret1-1-like protein [Holotrichia oblita]